MDIGPVDILEVAFPGNEFNGAILPALENLISSGTIRVLDLLFAYKTADGEVGSIELAGLTAQYGPLFASVDGDVPGGLLDAEDVAELTDVLEPNSSIAVICWENTWAAPFLQCAGGLGRGRHRSGESSAGSRVVGAGTGRGLRIGSWDFSE